MKESIKSLLIKYREIIVYLIVGGLTTVVSWAAKFLVNFIAFGGTAYPSAIQAFVLSVVEWVAGVAFAYPTNRKFVFESKDTRILKEAAKFIASRISTLVISVLLTQLLAAIGLNLYVYTIIVAVVVVIGNYVFSKLFVFRKEKQDKSV